MMTDGEANQVVRVIYRWRVPAENEEAFRSAWSRATQGIRESVAGARGSLLLRCASEPSELLTIARWDSVAHWRVFWGAETPAEMAFMHELGERLSVELYEEIEDHTV
jgi:heme-degrading monooxygenase HmoA